MLAFSSLVIILGERSAIRSPPALPLPPVEINSCTLIPLFRPGSVHSGSTSLEYYGRVFPDQLHVSSFLDRLRHCAWTAAQSAHSDFVGSRVYACLGVTCHLFLGQNVRVFLRATAVTWERNKHCVRVTTPSNHPILNKFDQFSASMTASSQHLLG